MKDAFDYPLSIAQQEVNGVERYIRLLLVILTLLLPEFTAND